MLFVVLVLTDVLPTVSPHKLALSIHLILLPLALVDSSVSPLVCPKTMDNGTNKFSLVNGSIGPAESTFSMLFALLIGSLVVCSILPI
jgi:hypothetical protein